MERFLAQEFLDVAKEHKLSQWWRDNSPDRCELPPWIEREILPSKPENKRTGIVEIIGLSQSGKSEAFRFLQGNLRGKEETIFQHELVVKLTADKEPEDWGKNKDHDRDVMVRRYGADYQMNLWNIAKIISFTDAINQKIKTGSPQMVSERGPNDVLATGSMVALLQSKKQEIPKELEIPILFDDEPFDADKYLLPSSTESFITTFFAALAYAEFVDAVVVFGIPFSTMTERRTVRDGAPQGAFNNAKNWPRLERAYGDYLGSFYPMFRKRLGTGLLVIDGTKPLEENNQKVLTYCTKVFEMANG